MSIIQTSDSQIVQADLSAFIIKDFWNIFPIFLVLYFQFQCCTSVPITFFFFFFFFLLILVFFSSFYASLLYSFSRKQLICFLKVSGIPHRGPNKRDFLSSLRCKKILYIFFSLFQRECPKINTKLFSLADLQT